jgi:hypothetical protein
MNLSRSIPCSNNNIRISFLLVIALLAIGLPACKKDQPDGAVSIVGKWNLKDYRRQQTENGKFTDEVIVPNLDEYLKLEANFTGTKPYYSSLKPMIDSFKYAIANNKLVLTYTNIPGTDVFEITEQTATSLKLHREFNLMTPPDKTVWDYNYVK